MKYFIIQLFVFALTLNVLGQEYSYFPTKNAFWCAMVCESGPMVPKSGFVKVGVFGDTVINSKTYHKLYLQRKYVNGKYSCDMCGFAFDKDSAFYFICYREENKIIYFVPQQNGFDDPPGKEYPVFNFNLVNIGETIIGYEYVFIPFGTTYNPIPTPGCGALQDTVTLTVESIDNVIMSDGSFRKRINFKPLTYGLQESWIEGIGSTKGFGFSLDITNTKNSMVCFSNNGINLETADILSQQLCSDSALTFDNRCEYTFPSSIDKLPINYQINVFPNPVFNIVKFTGLNPGDKISIYNFLGQIIYEDVSNSTEFVIDPFEFHKGIYIYTVTSLANVIKSGKIVKY
jgi:hypothetical protein